MKLTDECVLNKAVIVQFKCLNDNYSFLTHDPSMDTITVIDTPDVMKSSISWSSEGGI